MKFAEVVERELNESERLEYKGKRADKASIIKDLVALANNRGGELFHGVRQSGGKIEEIQGIADYSQFEEDINQTIASRVDPILPVEVRIIEHENSTIVGIQVDHQGLLHTLDTGNGKACIPIRVGSTTDYLDGAAIREFYRSRFESADSGLTGWLDQVRQQAHRITYSYEKNDFAEIEGRGDFAKTGNDVSEKLETRLREPHRGLDEKTSQLMEDVVSACEKMSNVQVSATSNLTLSGGGIDSSGYIGASPDEVEKTFREKADMVNEAAASLETHLKD